MEIDETIKELMTVREGDLPVLRVALFATLYVERAWERDVKLAVLDVFDRFRAMCGDHFRWYAHSKGRGKWLDARKEKVPPREWVPDEPSSRQWEMRYQGGTKHEEASDVSFEVFARANWEPHPIGYVSWYLPLTWYSGHSGSHLQFVADACRDLRPVHGYSGLGLAQSSNIDLETGNEPDAFALCRRFPGLECDMPGSHSLYLDGVDPRVKRAGIKGVNWLTVLDERWLPELGGLEALRASLAPDCPVRVPRDGVVIQAGPHPQLGDMNRGQIPGAYRKVYAAVKKVQVQGYPSGFHHAGPNRFHLEETLAWLRRFE